MNIFSVVVSTKSQISYNIEKRKSILTRFRAYRTRLKLKKVFLNYFNTFGFDFGFLYDFAQFYSILSEDSVKFYKAINNRDENRIFTINIENKDPMFIFLRYSDASIKIHKNFNDVVDTSFNETIDENTKKVILEFIKNITINYILED